MNNEEFINEVRRQTGKEDVICVDIINAYKKYCENELKLPFKKEVDILMIDWICTVTEYDEQTVNDVLNAFISLVRSEIKSKILFIK